MYSQNDVSQMKVKNVFQPQALEMKTGQPSF